MSWINGGTDLLTRSPVATLLQETLLRTDGTVTDLLELFTGENILIDKLQPGLYSSECDWPEVDASPGPIIRDVLLAGKDNRICRTSSPIHTCSRSDWRRRYKPNSPRPTNRSERCSGSIDSRISARSKSGAFAPSQQSPASSAGRQATRCGGVGTRSYPAGLVIMEITEVFSECLFETTP